MKLACPYCLKQSVYIFHRIITRNQSKHINPVLKIKITIAGGFRQWRDFLVRESWKLVSRLCSSQGNPHLHSCPIPCPPGFLVFVFNLISIKLSCQVLLCSARRAPWKAWALEPIKGWPPSRQGCHQGSRRSSHQRGGRLCQHHQRRRQPWGGWRWRVQVKDWQELLSFLKLLGPGWKDALTSGGGEVRLEPGNGWRRRRGFEKKGFFLTCLLYDSVASHHPTRVVKIAQIFSFYLVDLFIDWIFEGAPAPLSGTVTSKRQQEVKD